MIFDHRPISEINDQDLMDLIGNQEENLWIDFKERHYEGYRTDGEKYKREICKDVTAMANAEGGYILIGVGEEDKIAQRFVDIPETERKVESIHNTCHQHIVPRIAKLDVKPHRLRLPDKAYNLIIIHIPFSENRPHGFNSRGTLNFVKRYGDTTKEFQIEEFIPDLLARHQLPSLNDLRGQLDRIESQTTNILKEIGGSK